MFCPNCGRELQDDWAVCPNCGQPVHTDFQEGKNTGYQRNTVNSRGEDQKNTDSEKINNNGYMQDFVSDTYNTPDNEPEKQENGFEILREAYHESKMTRLKWSFIGTLLLAVIAFPLGHIISGIVFAISGILTMPWIIKKAGKKKIWLIIVGVILGLGGVFAWYYDDALREVGSIEYIKTYPTAMGDYTIEDFFELEFSEDELEWSYEEQYDKEYITVSFTEPDGVDESVVFSIGDDGYPILYDVIYDGKSNDDLFEDYNSRIFGESGTKSEKTEEQADTAKEASTEKSTENSTDASSTESVDSERTDKAQAAYPENLVVDSSESCQLETTNYTGIYYLPYINYESSACDEVNKRIDNLVAKYIDNTNETGSGCMGISYKWTLYGDILSLVIPLQFDADMVEYNVYVLDLKKDVLLAKKDLLAELNIDEADYEKNTQNAMDSCFNTLYGSFKGTDDYYDEVYKETIASENVAEARPYIDTDGTLSVVAKIYSMAGANYYYQTITLQSLDGGCKYSGESDNYNYKVLADTDSQSEPEVTEDTYTSEYILPYSDSEYISDSDLNGLTPGECHLALNEIYARHGRKFNDPDYRAYFNSKSWYNGTIEPDDFDDTALFNQYELANRDYIVDYEKRMGYR